MFSFRVGFKGSLFLSIIINMQIGKQSCKSSDQDLWYLSTFPSRNNGIYYHGKIMYMEAGKRRQQQGDGDRLSDGQG